MPRIANSSLRPMPPGPRSRFPGDMLLRSRRDTPGFLLRMARRYGDICAFKLGPQQVFLLNDPDLIKDVLVTNHRNFVKSRALVRAKRVLGEGLLTSEDPFHLRQRRLSQPAFHRERVQSYAAAMTENAVRVGEGWRDGAIVDLHREMMRLTLNIVSRTLFNTDVEEEARDIGAAMDAIMPLFMRALLPWSELIDELPLPSNKRFWRALARLDAIIYRIIDEHRQTGRDQGDLVSMLLLAQDEEGDGGQMTDRQVRDEAMTIFLAGHETTANALTFTWYLLARHPHVEARLHAEIDGVLGGRVPTVEDVPHLVYAEQVFAETMRMFPPAYLLARRALEDYEFAGYCAPADSVLLMSQWVTHHDARWFPDPFRFDPERWTPEAREARPKFSYFPFGSGPRLCIGEGFAWMEGVLLVATLAQQWKMRLAPGFRLELQPMITLRPRHGVRMRLERRSLQRG